MTTLLDGNVLVALSSPLHSHARSADLWLSQRQEAFATCPITQGTLIRYVLREGYSAEEARRALQRITSLPDHVFWPDDISYAEVRMDGVFGHRQVTDAYLAQLARHYRGRLATLDQALAALHSDVADLIPGATNGL